MQSRGRYRSAGYHPQLPADCSTKQLICTPWTAITQAAAAELVLSLTQSLRLLAGLTQHGLPRLLAFSSETHTATRLYAYGLCALAAMALRNSLLPDGVENSELIFTCAHARLLRGCTSPLGRSADAHLVCRGLVLLAPDWGQICRSLRHHVSA